MNIYDCRFVDNEANSIFHVKQLGNSKTEIEIFWRRYLAAEGSKISFVDVKHFSTIEDCNEKSDRENEHQHSVTYVVESVWVDPEKKKHSIEEKWEAHGADELIAVLRDVLDVPAPGIISGGIKKHAETLRRYSADEEFIISEWNRMEDAMKLYESAVTALVKMKNASSLYKDLPYVIKVDSCTTVYVNVIRK